MSEIREILKDLISMDSVSTRSNQEIAAYLGRVLETAGFRVEALIHEESDGTAKLNLVALAGPETDPLGQGGLALVGHTDTVPYDPEWAEALVGIEQDGKLFGRGACDTKAFIAAAITAARSVDLTRLSQPLALVFTYDEEIGCIGAKRLLEWGRLRPTYAIVGEPTGLTPIRANKGYCLARVEIRGKEGHSAYPDSGASAILAAGRLLTEIERLAEELKADTHDDFEPNYTTLNVGLIEGGKAKNVIAGTCHLTIEWRPIPGQPPERVYEGVVEAAARVQAGMPRIKIRILRDRVGAGADTPASSPVVQYLAEASGHAPATVAFGTEAPEMEQLGAEAVVFGPGDIRVAHQTGEFVPLDELDRCAEILSGAIEKFCL